MQDKLREVCGSSPRHIKSISAITDSFNIFLSLDTIEIIQAMLVLPFEHQRFKGIHDFDEKFSYEGEIEFWFYHLRDIKNSLEKANSKSE